MKSFQCVLHYVLSYCLILIFITACSSVDQSQVIVSTNAPVGQVGTNIFFTPTNQLLTPAGKLVELPGMRPQAIALFADGTRLITAGKTPEIVVVDPSSGEIMQRIALPADDEAHASVNPVSPRLLKPDKNGQLSYTGLVVSPDGTRAYLANVDGSIKVFGIDDKGTISALFTFPLPHANAPRREAEIPSGIAVSADGGKLYVCGNLSNHLLELDAKDGRVLRTWDVGVAPFDVVITAGKAYVSNWAGRRPDAQSLTGQVGRGTIARVDPVRFIASEGSVSIIDLQGNRVLTEIVTGMHASALASSPDGNWIVVANAGSDTLSVIDTRTDLIHETICMRQHPDDLFGAQPCALTFDPTGKSLYVCNGSQNAIAVIEFGPSENLLKRSRSIGLIPVGWFPGAIAIAHNAKGSILCAANIKGTALTQRLNVREKADSNSKQFRGSLSLVPLPCESDLKAMTQIALLNMRYGLLQDAKLPARAGQPPRPVPERVGEPSVFNHVVYIIKENRTYDQVLGDIPQGNGDASLCVFGENITPNQHKMVREFVLLDNTYCSGVLSADGHNWADSGIANEYLERSFAGFPRSYPSGAFENESDVLAYSSAGFLWDNAIASGKSLRVYGEFAETKKSWADTNRKGEIAFQDHWKDFTTGSAEVNVASVPTIDSLRPYLCTNTVGWDMDIPDVFRARQFITELKEYEKTGTLPNLIIIGLPNDHTSGTKAGVPSPAAHVADNDLAFGQIVQAISQSSFWKDTCIFAIEDDPQAGWDHVSGFRTTAYVISPYTKRGEVISTQYNQTSLLRTMELMLGMPPMNQMDASATPMSDCFNSTANYAYFASVPSNILLDQLNPQPSAIADPLLRENALASARLPLEKIDQCSEDQLNRILWHAMKGSSAVYPLWAISDVDDDDDDDEDVNKND